MKTTLDVSLLDNHRKHINESEREEKEEEKKVLDAECHARQHTQR